MQFCDLHGGDGRSPFAGEVVLWLRLGCSRDLRGSGFHRAGDDAVARGDDRRTGHDANRIAGAYGGEGARHATREGNEKQEYHNAEPYRVSFAERTSSFVRLPQHGGVTIRPRGGPATRGPAHYTAMHTPLPSPFS